MNHLGVDTSSFLIQKLTLLDSAKTLKAASARDVKKDRILIGNNIKNNNDEDNENNNIHVKKTTIAIIIIIVLSLHCSDKIGYSFNVSMHRCTLEF